MTKPKRIFEKDGQKYLRIGNKAIPFNDVDKHGKPIIKPEIIKTKTKDGKENIIIKLPALKVRIKNNQNG